MSSINNQNLANAAILQQQADDLNNDENQQISKKALVGDAAAAQSDPALVEAMAAMGLSPTGKAKVGKTDANNKFGLASSLTGNGPPLPKDRAAITQETQSLFQSLSSDMATAMAKAQPATAAAVGTDAAHTPNSTASVLQQLSTISDDEAQTFEGQAKVANVVASAVQSGAINISSLTNGGMMAAFMILDVENKASGKEVTATLQDLTADARKSSIDDQIAANKAAAEKVKEANDLQKKMGIFGPLIDAIMAIVTILVTVFTAGVGTALIAPAIGMAIGFVAGGVAGGASKGNGFDITSALSGAAMGGSVASLVAKLVVQLISKMLLQVGMRAGMDAVTKAGEKAAEIGAKVGGVSDKSSMAIIAASGVAGAVGTIAKAGMQYSYDMKTADAKELQAKAKWEKAISDMLQTQYQALSTSLQGMLEAHNTAVNRFLSMLKTHFGAMQKSIAQING